MQAWISIEPLSVYTIFQHSLVSEIKFAKASGSTCSCVWVQIWEPDLGPRDLQFQGLEVCTHTSAAQIAHGDSFPVGGCILICCPGLLAAAVAGGGGGGAAASAAAAAASAAPQKGTLEP